MATKRPLVLAPDVEGLDTASSLLRNGALVAIPTETVYGLGGNATSDEAVAAIFEAKGRPAFNPLIIHFASEETVWDHVIPNNVSRKLAGAFWPGPLTMVLPRRKTSSVSLLASAGLDTLAVRVPAHPVGHQLLDVVGLPIAAPSANRSGCISPTTPAHVVDSLGERIAAVVDGGACHIGLESTVVAVLDDRIVLLRPGSITREALGSVVNRVDHVTAHTDNQDAPPSPGMLERHYAPQTDIRLNAKPDDLKPGEVLLGFGPGLTENTPDGSKNLSETGDLREAAANLFAMMRDLDALGASGIAVVTIPDTGLGIAINDRLRRAATPEKP